MKIYVAVIEDKHNDIEVFSFTDKQKAIDWARTYAQNNNKSDLDAEQRLDKDMIKCGWVYFGITDYEDSYIYVMETELDSQLK